MRQRRPIERPDGERPKIGGEGRKGSFWAVACKDVHVVLDNGSSHAAKHTKAWLAAHPRGHVHWTPPHASWLNQVKLVFSALARAVLRHGDFTSRDDLIEKMDAWMLQGNEHARPFRWTYAGTPLKSA